MERRLGKTVNEEHFQEFENGHNDSLIIRRLESPNESIHGRNPHNGICALPNPFPRNTADYTHQVVVSLRRDNTVDEPNLRGRNEFPVNPVGDEAGPEPAAAVRRHYYFRNIFHCYTDSVCGDNMQR